LKTIDLTEKRCTPCTGEESPLAHEEITALQKRLDEGWKVVDGHYLEKEYDLEDFRKALDFTNKVGAIAEREDHHPDLELGWGRVQIQLTTHEIDGLSENDFIVAAKADQAFKNM